MSKQTLKIQTLNSADEETAILVRGSQPDELDPRWFWKMWHARFFCDFTLFGL